jgi:hypothetical protein
MPEAYDALADRVLASKNYKRSLELDPQKAPSAERLKALGTQ